jgi:hypothetical protein
MFAESDPHSGSVIAIAAHTPSKRRSCSSDATDAIAEFPSPCRGIDNSSPTSPQHISMIDSTDDRFDPFTTPSPASAVRRTPEAPAPEPVPEAPNPSTIAASMSSSTGYSCSARS